MKCQLPHPLTAITPGEPAGIGPDIVIQALQKPLPITPVIIADKNLMQERAEQLKLKLPSELLYHHVPLKTLCIPGVLNRDNATYVLETLDHAIQGCLTRDFQRLITGPVHKGIINEAGIPFTGHTEYLAKKTKSDHVVMMLATDNMRVALVTTHLPLSKVAESISKERVEKTIGIVHKALASQFHIQTPRILVTGLNPHAGENGHLGREEIDTIIPVIEQLKQAGLNVEGPFPADTIFTEKYTQQADAIIAMYHDQGLPVIKHIGFGNTVNITLGLPFLRSSVDHGTALDLAATGHANSSSLLTALTMSF